MGRDELTLDRDWIGLDDIISLVMRRAEPLMDEQLPGLEQNWVHLSQHHGRPRRRPRDTRQRGDVRQGIVTTADVSLN